MQTTSADLPCPVAVAFPDVASPTDVSTTVVLRTQHTTLASVCVPEQVASSSMSSAAARVKNRTKTWDINGHCAVSIYCKCVALGSPV